MTAIVCVDKNWAIGRDNQLLFRISADLRRFKTLTMGHVLLMGRRTFESLPGLLPGRVHVVLSRDAAFAPDGVKVCHSIPEGIAAARELGEVFVIGGAEIYAALLPFCETAIVTHVDTEVEQADAYFPNLSTLTNWKGIEVGEWQEEKGLRYRFCVYACE